MVRQDTIDKERDLLKAFLRAEIKGWTDIVKDPAAGADLAANIYGQDLGLTAAEQTLESEDPEHAHPQRRHQKQRPVHGRPTR